MPIKAPMFGSRATGVRVRPIDKDEVDRLYDTRRWRRFRRWILRLNPICQRIVDGVRCQDFSVEVHHRQSPRKRPDLFTVAENCVGLCKRHHKKSVGDEGNEVYADTIVD